LEWDDYGRRRAVPEGCLRGEYVRGRTSARNLLDAILLALDTAGVRPMVQLTDAQGQTPWGVEWKCVRYKGRVLVNVANHLNRPMDVLVTTAGLGSGKDLLSGRSVSDRLHLEPLSPVLVEYQQ